MLTDRLVVLRWPLVLCRVSNCSYAMFPLASNPNLLAPSSTLSLISGPSKAKRPRNIAKCHALSYPQRHPPSHEEKVRATFPFVAFHAETKVTKPYGIGSSAGKYQHQYAILATLGCELPKSDIEHPFASGLSTPITGITIQGWQQRPSNRRYSMPVND
jgi:hypothetical protein